MHATPAKTSRTSELIEDGDDQLVLGIVETGRLVTIHRGRELTLNPGEAALWSKADVSQTILPDSFHFIGVSIPRPTLRSQVTEVEDCLAKPLVGDDATIKLLGAYVLAFQKNAKSLPPDVRSLGKAHIHDLAVLALGANRDAGEIATKRGLRAARLKAVKADIVANLGHRDLTIDALARRHRISPRSLRELFSIEHTTFTDYMLNQRLAYVHRQLMDARYAYRTISALAFEAGFGDLSYFNHSFRRRYGATPSDIRQTARPDEIR